MTYPPSSSSPSKSLQRYSCIFSLPIRSIHRSLDSTLPRSWAKYARHGRDIAFSTPRLWRAAMIELRASAERSFPALLNILHTWLARSAHLPLSISLEVEAGIDCLDPRWAGVIITHAARWEAHDAGHSLRGFEDPEPAATVFHDAPLLTTVDLAMGFNPSYVTLPWSQLTRISFDRCEPVHVAHILRRAVSLVELSGSLWDDFIHFEDIPPLMHLRSLILLDVDAGLEVSNKMLLDALTTPALRHLTVSERELKDECISTIAALLFQITLSVKVIKVFVHTEDGPYDGEEEDTGEDDEGLSEDENDYKGENLGVEGD
ncbi:hypothetical protein C8J57DRAFT_1517185 [Mycena rebaudengoi]|nr:hypothetical protein C8J57DRAFT_1517185 [Mycena rebaudengoi]